MSDAPGDPDGDINPENESPIQFYVPPEQEAGVYSNIVAVWHTAYDFILDFGALQLTQKNDPDDAESAVVIPARVVSRVHVPVGLVFDLIRTTSARMETYEAEWGEIPRPERPEGEGDS